MNKKQHSKIEQEVKQNNKQHNNHFIYCICVLYLQWIQLSISS